MLSAAHDGKDGRRLGAAFPTDSVILDTRRRCMELYGPMVMLDPAWAKWFIGIPATAVVLEHTVQEGLSPVAGRWPLSYRGVVALGPDLSGYAAPDNKTA